MGKRKRGLSFDPIHEWRTVPPDLPLLTHLGVAAVAVRVVGYKARKRIEEERIEQLVRLAGGIENFTAAGQAQQDEADKKADVAPVGVSSEPDDAAPVEASELPSSWQSWVEPGLWRLRTTSGDEGRPPDGFSDALDSESATWIARAVLEVNHEIEPAEGNGQSSSPAV